MAKKKLLGIEIGNNRIKIAQCLDYELEKMITAEVPDNLVVDDIIVSWEAMADFIKDVIKENNIQYRNVSMVLPEKACYIKRIIMPAMTVDQLKVNLPFEFHDYITEDKDKYFYDYAVIEMRNDENGKPKEMELMAVAVLKDTVEKYQIMLRRAGLKLTLMAPEFAAFKNIIEDYEDLQERGGQRPGDYVILDLGHRLLRMHFFAGGKYEITRNMEPGCDEITRIIAAKLDVDEHIAQINKEQNKDDILNDAECMEVYNRMAVEIMRVLNFYNFNHPENTLEKLYCCGGGSYIRPLIQVISDMIEIEVVSMGEMIAEDTEDRETVIIDPQPLGIVWE